MPKHPKAKTKTTTALQKDDSLDSVYSAIEAALKRHAPPLRFADLGVRNKKSAQITVPKPVVIPGAYGGKPVMHPLAAVIHQKGYVGFYFMCVHGNDKVRKQLSPAFLKLLKGKACFHVTRLDEGLRKDIATALKLGEQCYRDRGWL